LTAGILKAHPEWAVQTGMPFRQEDGHRVRRVFAALLLGLTAASTAACTAAPPAETTTTTTTAAPMPSSNATITATITSVFGTNAAEAIKIAQCESGLRPTAVSPTNDHGLFQINAVHQPDFTRATGQPWSAVYDAMTNTRYAKWLYDRQGWAPWSCKRVLTS
jgi:hypothetical protein